MQNVLLLFVNTVHLFVGELSLHGLKVNVFDSDAKKLKNVHEVIEQQREELISNGLIPQESNVS